MKQINGDAGDQVLKQAIEGPRRRHVNNGGRFVFFRGQIPSSVDTICLGAVFGCGGSCYWGKILERKSKTFEGRRSWDIRPYQEFRGDRSIGDIEKD